MKKSSLWLAAALLAVFALLSGVEPALAQFIPDNAAVNLQPAATPVMERIHDFHTLLLWVIFGICILVMLLLLVVIVRFNRRASPTPSQFTHNMPLEVAWTVVPVLILIIIAVPSMKLLYYGDRTAEPEMTLKVTGYQWYWGYEYPDHGDIAFNAYMIPDEEIDVAAGQRRLLSTDRAVVLPVDTDIQVLVTAADVLHSFAVPAFGIKTDAVPGRTNETWIRITKPGVYYGQCSELCGKDHAFMPIEVHAVSKEEFEQWVAGQNGETAANTIDSAPATRLARNAFIAEEIE